MAFDALTRALSKASKDHRNLQIFVKTHSLVFSLRSKEAIPEYGDALRAPISIDPDIK